MKAINKLVKTISNQGNNKNRKKATKNKVVGRKPRIRRNRRRMPAAMTDKFEKQFSVVSQTNNTMRVRGRDLIYQIPDDITAVSQDTNVITVIPANPAYWTGTRISALASGYQNYRPLKFTLNYVPQCAVTQQGNVIAGTLWNQAPTDNNLQQTLRTSNGGMLTQCYARAMTSVNLKTNLQFNLYRMAGEFNQESNPFVFLALAVGCVDLNGRKINPGYFYVSYEFIFKNPIGNTIMYYNSQLTGITNLPVPFVNVSLVNCKMFINPDNQEIPIGAVLQDDLRANSRVITYYGTEVMLPEDAVFWIFANSQVAVNDIQPTPIVEIQYLEEVQPTDTSGTYTFRLSSGNVSNTGYTFYLQQPDGFTDVYTLIAKTIASEPTPTVIDVIVPASTRCYMMLVTTWVNRHYPAGNVQTYNFTDGRQYHGVLDRTSEYVFTPLS